MNTRRGFFAWLGAAIAAPFARVDIRTLRQHETFDVPAGADIPLATEPGRVLHGYGPAYFVKLVSAAPIRVGAMVAINEDGMAVPAESGHLVVGKALTVQGELVAVDATAWLFAPDP